MKRRKADLKNIVACRAHADGFPVMINDCPALLPRRSNRPLAPAIGVLKKGRWQNKTHNFIAMAYDEKLAGRIRGALAHLANVEEKKMFKGIAFMVDGKMCVNVSGDEMMCRFDPLLQEAVTEKKGFREMIMKNKVLRGYCYISSEGIRLQKDFEYWIDLCLQFNKEAKASRKKKKKSI